ncbi:hypothetical protein IHN57_06965 [Deinococcus sp. 6GRE01]|nr:hypothetical protein [Deinococcus sp. 6GRE01]
MDRADLLALALELGNSPMFRDLSDLQSRRTLELLDDEPLRHKVEALVTEYRDAHESHCGAARRSCGARACAGLADMDRRALIVRLMEFGDFPLFRHIYDLQSRRLLELLDDQQLCGKIGRLIREYREAHD